MTVSDTETYQPHHDLPTELAAILRPELDSLTEEIIDDIRSSLPEYARPLDGPYGTSIQDGVYYALKLFVDQIDEPDVTKEDSLSLHRKLGHLEMREGRTLDTLQAAYRIGARVSWRRIMEVGKQAELSADVMSTLADTMMAFLDDLAAVALDGYLEARTKSSEALDTWRRRLLGMILERPQGPRGAIEELAELVSWTVPDHVCAIAVHPYSAIGDNDRPAKLDSDVLVQLTGTEPHLLVPGEVSDRRLRSLQRALPGRRISVGPCRPLEEAAESLRLARQTIELASTGSIPAKRVAWAQQHYATLLLRSDDGVLDRLCHRWFARLQELTPKQHARLIETLRAWIEEQGSIPQIAERLGMHAQSVRYRLRLLEELYGDSLHDPNARFEMQLVLRAGPRHPGAKSATTAPSSPQ